MTTAREFDTNGWVEIKKNPISKCGVFPYLGSSIPIVGLDPTKFYNVYRPAEELSNPDTIESFKLLPWVDDHAMIGPKEDTAAEEKGVHGVTGEDVFFEEPFLYSNIKLFSEQLAKKIENDKRELSLGYRAKWFVEEGVYDGIPYHIVQRDIRGNHLASVREGRSGHEVAVLDHKETLEGVSKMDDEKQEFSSLKEVVAELRKCIEKLMGAEKEEVMDENSEMRKNGMMKKEPVEDEKEDEAEKEKGKKKEAEDEKEDEKEDGYAMDAAELTRNIFSQLAKRDALAKRAFKDEKVGVFDASEMTLEETAKYVVKKLGLSCAKGHENSVLAGYFAAATVNQPVITQARVGAGMDSAGIQSPQIRKMLHGED